MAEEAEDLFGPIDVVVVEFPDGAPTPSGFDGLLALVDSGHIRVLDVEFVRKRSGVVEPVDIGDLDQPSVSSFAGASSGLLDADDLAQLADDLADDALAVIVVFEELSILRVLEAWEADGAHVVAAGHLTPVELAEALDATDEETTP